MPTCQACGRHLPMTALERARLGAEARWKKRQAEAPRPEPVRPKAPPSPATRTEPEPVPLRPVKARAPVATATASTARCAKCEGPPPCFGRPRCPCPHHGTP